MEEEHWLLEYAENGPSRAHPGYLTILDNSGLWAKYARALHPTAHVEYLDGIRRPRQPRRTKDQVFSEVQCPSRASSSCVLFLESKGVCHPRFIIINETIKSYRLHPRSHTLSKLQNRFNRTSKRYTTAHTAPIIKV